MLRAVVLVAVAFAIFLAAAWLRERADLGIPAPSADAPSASGPRALRTARTLARLERLDAAAGGSPLVLNEIASTNPHALLDEALQPSDWLELFNRSTKSVALAGYSLADGRSSARRWRLPDLDLAPGAHLVLFASGGDRVGSVLAHRVAGFVHEGGADRAEATVEHEFVLPVPGTFDLWLSVRAEGVGGRLRVSVAGDEPIELWIPGGRRLQHLRVPAVAAGPAAVRVSVTAGDAAVWLERLSLALPDQDVGPFGLHLHTDFRLGRRGETLVLLDPRGRAADYATPDRIEPGRTWQRRPEGGDEIVTAPPTPWGRALAPAPDLTGPPSVSSDPLSVSVDVPPGVERLTYTLDGAVPGPDAAPVEGAIVLARPAVLRVRGFASGRPVTPVATRAFWVGARPDALVVLLGIDPWALVDPEWGIVPNNAERGAAWERVAYALVFDREGVVLDAPVGLRTHAGSGDDRGRHTSFQLRLRPSLGAERLARDPFEPRLEPTPDRLVLDASPVAWADKLAYDLAAAAGGVAPRSRGAVLFMNGTLHNQVFVFEDVDRHFLLSRFGHNDFDLIKGKPFKVKQGDRALLDALARRLDDPNLTAAEAGRFVDLRAALAAHFAMLFADAGQAAQFPDDAVQGYLAIDRSRTDPRVVAIPWDLDHGFRSRGFAALAPHRSFLRTQAWDTRYLTERVLDRLLESDPAFVERYTRAAEAFLEMAAEPRWAREIDVLAALDERWARPRSAQEGWDDPGYRAARRAVFERVRAIFAERPDELRRQWAELSAPSKG